jgi:hypothetical protein
MMNNSEKWYIVKEENGHCQIVSSETETTPEAEKIWGPFLSSQEAIARRVGLIRAGKCKPI